jgi:hypothetical protein
MFKAVLDQILRTQHNKIDSQELRTCKKSSFIPMTYKTKVSYNLIFKNFGFIHFLVKINCKDLLNLQFILKFCT